MFSRVKHTSVRIFHVRAVHSSLQLWLQELVLCAERPRKQGLSSMCYHARRQLREGLYERYLLVCVVLPAIFHEQGHIIRKGTEGFHWQAAAGQESVRRLRQLRGAKTTELLPPDPTPPPRSQLLRREPVRDSECNCRLSSFQEHVILKLCRGCSALTA